MARIKGLRDITRREWVIIGGSLVIALVDAVLGDWIGMGWWCFMALATGIYICYE